MKLRQTITFDVDEDCAMEVQMLPPGSAKGAYTFGEVESPERQQFKSCGDGSYVRRRLYPEDYFEQA